MVTCHFMMLYVRWAITICSLQLLIGKEGATMLTRQVVDKKWQIGAILAITRANASHQE